MEEKVKKIFEEPTVQKVEFDFKTRIAASSCGMPIDSDASSCNLGY